MRRVAVVALLGLASLLHVGCGVAAGQERERVAAVGRVSYIDTYYGVIVVEFPEGRRTISMDMRELSYYRQGDEFRIDQAGRPLPPSKQR